MKLTYSVAPVILLATSVIFGCAEPRTEAPVPTPEPATSVPVEEEQATKEPVQTGPATASKGEPTLASESEYNRDITKATTSQGLSNADIAWHALNTYGWDCEEVVARESQVGDYFVVTCANGTKLRVYPRAGQHPRITNSSGGYN
jgi:hypothetical protein